MPFHEMFEPDGSIRPCYAEVQKWVERTGISGLNRRLDEAEAIFRRIGITFAVYGEGGDPERLIPFDLLPRIFTAQEWRVLDKGIRQRARALNAFLHDVYHRGEIVKAGIMPADIIYQNSAYLAEMADFSDRKSVV